jgi:hypothetical protein
MEENAMTSEVTISEPETSSALSASFTTNPTVLRGVRTTTMGASYAPEEGLRLRKS